MIELDRQKKQFVSLRWAQFYVLVGELIYTCKVIFAGKTCIFCQVWTWQNKPEKYVSLDPRL